jgi:hypothetical protein
MSSNQYFSITYVLPTRMHRIRLTGPPADFIGLTGLLALIVTILIRATSNSTALKQSEKLGKTSGYPPPTVQALRAQRNGRHGAFPSSAGYCIRARPSAWELTGLLSETVQLRDRDVNHLSESEVGWCGYPRNRAGMRNGWFASSNRGLCCLTAHPW